MLAISKQVTSFEHFKLCGSACGHFTHMGFIRQRNILCGALGKVAISAAKYSHSGLCNLDHWSRRNSNRGL